LSGHTPAIEGRHKLLENPRIAREFEDLAAHVVPGKKLTTKKLRSLMPLTLKRLVKGEILPKDVESFFLIVFYSLSWCTGMTSRAIHTSARWWQQT
jgi:hypothetical protein